MTTFDWIVLAVIVLSTLTAFFRGVVRELVGIVAWVVGFVAAIAYTPALGAALPEIPGHPSVRYVIAFVVIVIAALIAGALIAWPLTRVIRLAGLGFVDRFLGAIFGVLRGAAFLLAFALVAGLTPLPQTTWWQSSLFVPPLVAGVMALRPYLPSSLVARLDYSPGGARPGAMPVVTRLPVRDRPPHFLVSA
jgi:membrane protein required for colicin V production